VPQQQRFCIYCGGPGLSKEDIWPIWAKPYVPRNMPRYSFMRGVLNPNQQLQRDAKIISGDPQSRKVRAVCRKCNNGWMSVLQEHTKPVILPILKGERTVLDRTKQNILAAWAAMTVICAEYIEPTRASISVVDRRHLFKNKQAPERLRLWIGNYQRNRWPAR